MPDAKVLGRREEERAQRYPRHRAGPADDDGDDAHYQRVHPHRRRHVHVHRNEDTGRAGQRRPEDKAREDYCVGRDAGDEGQLRVVGDGPHRDAEPGLFDEEPHQDRKGNGHGDYPYLDRRDARAEDRQPHADDAGPEGLGLVAEDERYRVLEDDVRAEGREEEDQGRRAPAPEGSVKD